ncbi:unnamed protein product [Closterium sp. Naga37s-1]|nr:unnamed protein product [Closterium sp. Naga37s-1]
MLRQQRNSKSFSRRILPRRATVACKFLLQADASWVRRKEAIYQPLKNNVQLVTLHWQHTEDTAYAREKALNPHAIEIFIKGVSVAVEMDMIHDHLVTYPLKSSKRSTILRGSCLHRALHPVTGADTDVVKALVYAHPENRNRRWIHALADPANRCVAESIAIALISTFSSREDWICTHAGCGKAKGKSLMAAADHISVAAHLQQLAKAGSATKQSLDKINLTAIRKECGL